MCARLLRECNFVPLCVCVCASIFLFEIFTTLYAHGAACGLFYCLTLLQFKSSFNLLEASRNKLAGTLI